MSRRTDIHIAIIAPIVFRKMIPPDGKFGALADSIVRSLADSGYAIVPIEPTEAMITDGYNRYDYDNFHFDALEIYRAMVKAGRVDPTD